MLLQCEHCKCQYDPNKTPRVENYHGKHFDSTTCRINYINRENRQLELRLEVFQTPAGQVTGPWIGAPFDE